ncbi:MAG TPA: MbcA/ParS/Xre antitoxin family protein [Candidatus Acidoferrales bacterium]|jgi:putative toxin-antitoxin system antitoxin component (TIGR02293 family)|nr:MbcA/ParS/Xre antitoxin family protein [Candidatus Acidoferrales bacterium]
MLTREDKEDIKRLFVEAVAESGMRMQGSDPVVDVVAKAIEVFGTRERALRWLKTPVRSLGDQTPVSLLNTPEGVAQVRDTLGRVEHGVW